MELCSPNIPTQSRGLSHPSSIAPACFWLVIMSKILNGGHLQPRHILFLESFHCSIHCPKQRNNTPPYAPPQQRVLSIIHSIASTNYWVIVMSYNQMMAT
jgi:hypothetical protein